MQNKLNEEQKRAVWSWAVSALCHCQEDELGNRPCDNGVLCDRCTCSDVEGLMNYKIQQLEDALEPIKAGDTISIMGEDFQVESIIYQELAVRFDTTVPTACYAIGFWDTKGEHHSWKSWIDDGKVIRAGQDELDGMRVFARCQTRLYIESCYVDLDWESVWDEMLDEVCFKEDLAWCTNERELIDLVQAYADYVLEEFGPDRFSTRDWQV